MKKQTDLKILGDSCWGLCYAIKNRIKCMEYLFKQGILPNLLKLMVHAQVRISVPAIRLVGNMTIGSDIQTQAIIDGGVLNNLQLLLASKQKKIRKESCWLISNIAAGTAEQLQRLLESGILPMLLDILKKDVANIKCEVLWTILNISSKLQTKYLPSLLSYNVIEGLCNSLETTDVNIVKIALESLLKFLARSEEIKQGKNLVVTKIEECGGLKSIEKFQLIKNMEIFNLVKKIIDVYFSRMEDDELIENNDELLNQE